MVSCCSVNFTLQLCKLQFANAPGLVKSNFPGRGSYTEDTAAIGHKKAAVWRLLFYRI